MYVHARFFTSQRALLPSIGKRPTYLTSACLYVALHCCMRSPMAIMLSVNSALLKWSVSVYQRGFDIGRVQSCVLRIPKYWPPTPLSTRRVCPPPAVRRGGGGGGSIFWKTQDIGLASYSKNLSTVYIFQWSLECGARWVRATPPQASALPTPLPTSWATPWACAMMASPTTSAR